MERTYVFESMLRKKQIYFENTKADILNGVHLFESSNINPIDTEAPLSFKDRTNSTCYTLSLSHIGHTFVTPTHFLRNESPLFTLPDIQKSLYAP